MRLLVRKPMNWNLNKTSSTRASTSWSVRRRTYCVGSSSRHRQRMMSGGPMTHTGKVPSVPFAPASTSQASMSSSRRTWRLAWRPCACSASVCPPCYPLTLARSPGQRTDKMGRQLALLQRPPRAWRRQGHQLCWHPTAELLAQLARAPTSPPRMRPAAADLQQRTRHVPATGLKVLAGVLRARPARQTVSPPKHRLLQDAYPAGGGRWCKTPCGGSHRRGVPNIRRTAAAATAATAGGLLGRCYWPHAAGRSAHWRSGRR